MRFLVIASVGLLSLGSLIYIFEEVSKEPESSFSLEEVVFLLDAESSNTLIFSSKALEYLNKNEIPEAMQLLRSLVEINLEVISNRIESPESVSLRELGGPNDRSLMLLAALKKTRRNLKSQTIGDIDSLIIKIDSVAPSSASH